MANGTIKPLEIGLALVFRNLWRVNAGDADLLAAWEQRNAQPLERAQRLLAELADAKTADLAMLSVALRELRNLA